MSCTSGLDVVEQRKIQGTGIMMKKNGITTVSLAKYINLHMQQHHKCHIDAELFYDTFYWRSLILAVGSERPFTLGS
jgi:hypothetical protein